MKYFIFLPFLFTQYVFSSDLLSEHYEIKAYGNNVILLMHLYNEKKKISIKKIIEPNIGVFWHGYAIPKIGPTVHYVQTIKAPPRSKFEVQFDITDRYDFRVGLNDYTCRIHNDLIHKKGYTLINLKFDNSFRKPFFTDEQIISPPKL